MTTIEAAIANAERLLPGQAAPDGAPDPRWQAVIELGEYIATNPEEVWQFICKWCSHEDDDLRDSIATCLLEELLADHFDQYFPLVEARAISDPLFRQTFATCWKMGQSELPQSAIKFDPLQSMRR